MEQFWTGYFAIYDKEFSTLASRGYHLDYPPLRLLIMALWAKWTLAHFPIWLGAILFSLSISLPLFFIKKRRPWIISSFIAGLISLLPWIIWPQSMSHQYPAILLALFLATSPWILKKHNAGYWIALTLTASICLAVAAFNGSLAWFKIGIVLPTDHYRVPTLGAVFNLPGIMSLRYGWRLDNIIWTFHSDHMKTTFPITMQWGLRYIYAIGLILCAIGLSIQARRRSARTLIAMAAPALLFYALLPQMHERYLIWAATMTVVGVGVSTGMTLLHLLITSIAFFPVLHGMLLFNPKASPVWFQGLSKLNPDLGWMVLLITAIYIYYSLAPDRKISLLPMNHSKKSQPHSIPTLAATPA